MRKITVSLILLAAALLAGISCASLKEAPTPVATYLGITPSEDVTQGVLGENALEFAVRCDAPWTVELSDPSWGKIEGIKQDANGYNGVFQLVTGPNPGFEDRTNTIVLSSGEKKTEVTVTQYGWSIIVPKKSLAFPRLALGSSITIYPPTAWEATVDAPEGWFAAEPLSGKSGKVEIKLSAKDLNEDKGRREGRIHFSFGSYEVDMEVAQDQKDVISLSSSPTLLSCFSQELVVDTRTNVTYKIEVDADWIRHVGTKALDEAREAFLVEQNTSPEPRQATISFLCEGEDALSAKVDVTQLGDDPVLHVQEYGAYGLGGRDFLLGDMYTQMSRLHTSEGQTVMRFLAPSAVQIVSVEGLTPETSFGEELTIKLKETDHGFPSFVREVPCLVIMTDEKTVWAKASDGSSAFFVLKK